MKSRFLLKFLAAIIFIMGFLINGNDLFAQTCPVSNELIINVSPQPGITIGSPTTICAGGSATLTATPSGGAGTCTIQWQISTDGTSFTNIPSANGTTFNTGALTQNRTYRATYTCTAGGCNAATSGNVLITVVPTPTVSITGGGVTLCTGGTVSLTAVPANGTGAPTYLWEVSTNGGTSYSTVGTNSPNFTSSAITQNSIFRVTTSYAASGCSSAQSTTPITIVADPSVTTQPGNATICQGGSTTLTVAATGGTPSLTYQWQYNNSGTWANVVNGTPAGSSYSNQTTTSLGISGITSTAPHSYRVIVSSSGVGCDQATSNAGIVTVVADPSITTQPTGGTICTSGSFSLTGAAAGGTPSLNLQWQFNNGGTWANVANGTPAGANYSNPTTGTLGVSGFTTAGSYEYRLAVSATGSGCDPINSNPATIVVVAGPVINTQPSGGAICVGGTRDLTVSASGGTGALTYQWQYNNAGTWGNVANGVPNGATYTNATSPTLTASGITATGTHPFRVIITSAGNGCGVLTSSTANVVVSPDPSITTQPDGGAAICQGGQRILNVVATGGSPSLNYQWQFNNGGTWASVANGTPAGSTYSGGTSNSLTINGTTQVGNHQYRVNISSTDNGCDAITSNVATVAVVADPSISTQPVGGPICQGGSLSMSVVASGGTPSLGYQWQYNNAGTWGNVTNGIPAGSSYTGGTSATLNISGTTAVGNQDYRVIVSATGNDCNSVTSSTATMAVSQDPTINTQPTGGNICQGGSQTLTVAAVGGTPGLNYQWQYNNGGTWGNVVNNTPAGASYTGGTSNSLQVSGITAVNNHVYRVIVSASGVDCNTVTSNTATIGVSQDPTITLQPISGSICSGGAFSLATTATGGTPSLIYQWQYNNGGTWGNVTNGTPTGSNYSGGTSNTLNITGTSAVGSFDYRLLVSATGSDCNTATSSTATMSVVAGPSIVTQPTGGPICQGGSINLAVSATGGTPGLNYQWQYNNGGTWANVVNGTPTGSSYTGNTSNSLQVSGITVVASHDYRVVINSTGNGCGSLNSNAATVVVNQDPTITTQPVGNTICVGSTGTHTFTTTATGGTPSLTYQWQYNNGGTWANVVNGTPTGSTYTGGTSTSLVVTGISITGTFPYRVLASATGSDCGTATSSPANLVIVADPSITTQPVGNTICEGGSHTMSVVAANGTPSLNYQWQYNNGGTWANVTNGTPTGSSYTGSNTNSLTVNGITAIASHQFRSVISSTGSGCDAINTNPAILIVQPSPTVSISGGGVTVCNGGNVTLTANPTGVGTPTYVWESSTNGTVWTGVGTNSPTFTTSALTVTTQFRVTVSYTGSGCNNATANTTISVVADPTVSVAGPTEICTGGVVPLNATLVDPSGSCTIIWQQRVTATDAWQDIPGATGPTYNSVPLSADQRFRVRLNCTISGCCN
jgi:hypothetical protein